MSSPGSQSGLVLGVIVATLVLSSIIIGLRLYARIFALRAFGADDVFIIITWVIVVAYNSCILASVHHGYGEHNYYLTSEQYLQVVKYEVIGQLFAVLAYVPGKISVAICLGRIFPGKTLHCFLWFIAILNFVDFVGMGIIQLAQCAPAAKQWDPSIPGSCIRPQIVVDYVLPGAVIGAGSDFVLAAIPWYYIRKLQMSRREKLGIGIALSLGFVAGGFAIVKSYYTTTLSSRTDYAYDTVPLVLWSVGEQCAISVAASIPMLRPLLPQRQRTQSAQSKAGRYSASGEKGRVAAPFLQRRRQPLDSIDRALAVPSATSKGGSIMVDHEIEITSYERSDHIDRPGGTT